MIKARLRPFPPGADEAVHDNLRNLQLDVLDVVNLRIMFSAHGPAEGSIAEPLSTAELQQQGLVRHIGLSNVTATQVAEAQKMVPVVCVQNMYNIVNRSDDALVDSLAQRGLLMCRSSRWAVLRRCNLPGCRRWRTTRGDTDAGCAGTAAATFSEHSADPGTSSVAHLRQNIAAGELVLPPDALATLNALV